MKILRVAVIATVLALAPATAAHADTDPPKGNDTGCCFSFDDSPVNIFFCATKDACRIEVPPK